MENGKYRWSSMLYLFLAGGVAGASAGLLLAPQSGRATRDTMRRKLHDTGTFARDLRDRVTRQSDGLRERAARGLARVAGQLSPTRSASA